MLIIYTQNKAFVNISNFNRIFATQDENGEIIITDGEVVLGKYQSERECIIVLDWLAQIFGNSDPNKNTVITMPYGVEDNYGNNNTETTEPIGEIPTEKN